MDVGHEVAKREVVFPLPDGTKVRADERYFLVRVRDRRIDVTGLEAPEARHITRYRWWSVDQLAATMETVYPEEIVKLVRELL